MNSDSATSEFRERMAIKPDNLRYERIVRDMNEQQMETLDRLFPKGYVILAKTQNDALHLRLFNPCGYLSLVDAERVVDTYLRVESGGTWPRHGYPRPDMDGAM